MKILLLGGSAQQIPAIKFAKEQGYYTIVCDFLSNNPGQNYADKYYCVSTTDRTAILNVAKKERVDGIVAYASDPAAPVAAYVSEILNLPTNPYQAIRTLADKEEFRKFLKENGFFTPMAQGFNSISEVKEYIHNFSFPVIIKPVDSSGSKGVSIAHGIDELPKLVNSALTFSQSKKIIIEEYVKMKGYQVAGDGFCVNGELKFYCFGNDHFDNKGINSFVPVSASFPYNMPKVIHQKISLEIQRLFDILGIKMGAFNFDIRIDQNDNVFLMEVGPRNGGNYIPQVIEKATGINLIEYTIRAAMGKDCSELEMKEVEGFWSYYAIHSSKAGILKDIIIKDSVREENIIESYINYNIGDEVPAFTAANGSLGILIMKFEREEKMLNMMDHPEKWIEVLVI